MTDDRFENIPEDFEAKAKKCKTADELYTLAKSEGVELSLEDLDAASGGWSNANCPNDSCPTQSCGTMMF